MCKHKADLQRFEEILNRKRKEECAFEVFVFMIKDCKIEAIRVSKCEIANIKS